MKEAESQTDKVLNREKNERQFYLMSFFISTTSTWLLVEVVMPLESLGEKNKSARNKHSKKPSINFSNSITNKRLMNIEDFFAKFGYVPISVQ